MGSQNGINGNHLVLKLSESVFQADPITADFVLITLIGFQVQCPSIRKDLVTRGSS